MFVKMDLRSFLNIAFRQMRKFLLVFIPILVLGVLYLMSVTPQYDSNAKLLIKFGQDARPEVSLNQQTNSNLSAEEKRGLVQSNLNILTSRDLEEKLLGKVTLARLYPEIARKNPEPAKARAAAESRLNNDIVTKTESDAGIINISILNPDPKIATETLKTLIDLFLESQSEIYGNPQMDVLRAQADEANQKLEKANQALTSYKAQNGIASIDEELTLLLKQRSDMSGYLSRRETTTSPAGQATGETQTGLPSMPPTSPSAQYATGALPARIGVDGDSSRFPVLDDIQRNLDDLRLKQSELRQTYKPDSSVMKNLNRRIAAETAALNQSVQAINDQIASIDQQIADKQQHRAAYNDLDRQVNLTSEAYKTAQTRLQAAEVNNDLNQRKISRVSVIEQPALRLKPSKPNKPLILALCLIIGAAFGLALCLLAEILDGTFNRSEQLAHQLDKPMLASFPFRKKTLPANDVIGLYQAVDSLLPVTGSTRSRMVCLASCYAGEGTTTIAWELARMAADKLGRRVLLIDSKDFLNSKVLSGTPAEISLLDVAGGTATLDAALTTVPADSSIVTHAFLAEDGQLELVLANPEKFGHVLSQLRDRFSLILITAPCLITTPVQMAIGRLADGVVMVVQAERTRAPVVRQALLQLKERGVTVLGLVLNKQMFYIPDWLYRRL